MSTIDEMRKQADAAFSLEVHSTQIGNELIRAATGMRASGDPRGEKSAAVAERAAADLLAIRMGHAPAESEYQRGRRAAAVEINALVTAFIAERWSPFGDRPASPPAGVLRLAILIDSAAAKEDHRRG